MSNKKQALIDLLKVFASNVLSLISGILVGFIIPKIMGYTDYGYYKLYSLYAAYTGLLHFGLSDGMYFYFSGQKIEDIDKKKLHSCLLFVIIMEAAISISGIIISSFFTSENPYGVIFIFVFLFSFFYQVQGVLSYVCQALKKFSFSSLINSLKSLLDALGVLCLYLVTKYSDGFQTSFLIYCTIVVSTMAIEAIFYVVYFWRILFGKGQNFEQTRYDMAGFLKIGFPIMIANLTSSLILAIDKQFVSIFYPVEESNIFSIFSFSYSVLTLITAATSAISIVLFPYTKGKDEKKLCELFPNLNSFLLVGVGISCSSFFVVQWIISTFLSKYISSVPIIRVIVPGLIINSSVTVLMHNYYKTFNKERVYFIQNILVLLFAIVTDIMTYYWIILPFDPNNPIWFAVASDITLLFWYIISESFLAKNYHIKHWKNDIYALSLCCIFYLTSFFLDQWIGFGVYLVSVLLASYLFFFKETKALLQMARAKHNQIKTKNN